MKRHLLTERDVWLISNAVLDAKLPAGNEKAWFKELEARNGAAYFKLLLSLVPNLKELSVEFEELEYLSALNEVAEGCHLLHLEKLGMNEDKENGVWTPLHQFLSVLELPSLRELHAWCIDADGYEELDKVACGENGPNLDQSIAQTSKQPHLEILRFLCSFISPSYLTDFLATCQLRYFEYKMDDWFFSKKWAFGRGPVEPPELLKALSQHKGTLESLVLPNLYRDYIFVLGISRSNDFTIGSLTDFCSLKHLDIEQSILLGDPDVGECIPCRWANEKGE